MKRVLALMAGILTAGVATAGPVSFASGWAEQRLQIFNSNDFTFGNSLGVASDGAVSLVWTRTERADWGRSAASWQWAVDQSVVATDLGQKGGDDRNLSLYFVFLPPDIAEGLQGANIRQLNRNPDVRILQYVWGGAHSRGQIIASPYAPGQGVTIVLRPAGTGAHSESVDLHADFTRAFGGPPGALVGLAVSADSDDTDGQIRGSIGGLTLN